MQKIGLGFIIALAMAALIFMTVLFIIGFSLYQLGVARIFLIGIFMAATWALKYVPISKEPRALVLISAVH